jgi:hypothetical protein
MPKMIDEIIQAYKKHTGKEVKSFSTPGLIGETFTKNTDEDPTRINAYCSIVGKIMYLVTKIFPEGANTVRELTKHFSNPGEEHWKALQRFIGYLKANKEDIYV